jgi:hypothetical protein
MKIKMLAALVAVVGTCLVAGCGDEKPSSAIAPAVAPPGGNVPAPPPAIGGPAKGQGPQGAPPPPAAH